jgi:hypothetical protein
MMRKPPPRASLVASSSKLFGKFNTDRINKNDSVVADRVHGDEGRAIVRRANDTNDSDDDMILEDLSLWVVGYGESR